MPQRTIEITDDAGNWQAEATQEKAGQPWEIRYDFGEERFHGKAPEIRARMIARLAEAAAE